MGIDVGQERMALERLCVPKLRERYREVFGEPTRSRHKQSLLRRILWRLQALAEGDLSERARRRAAELARDADLRVLPPRAEPPRPVRFERRRGLPAAGTILLRRYKGQLLEVSVRDNGFDYDGQHYRSLSAVAQAITGQHWNGPHFFGLSQKGDVA